jgi:hypothetical protein
MFLVKVRWLAPPANLHQPSGLKRQTDTYAKRYGRGATRPDAASDTHARNRS